MTRFPDHADSASAPRRSPRRLIFLFVFLLGFTSNGFALNATLRVSGNGPWETEATAVSNCQTPTAWIYANGDDVCGKADEPLLTSKCSWTFGICDLRQGENLLEAIAVGQDRTSPESCGPGYNAYDRRVMKVDHKPSGSAFPRRRVPTAGSTSR